MKQPEWFQKVEGTKKMANSYGNIKIKKIVLLKLIYQIGGSNEIWIGDLIKLILELPPEFSEEYDLNYKENSLYRSIDRMTLQNLLEKYKKKGKPKTHRYVKVSELGLKILENIKNLFGDNEKIIKKDINSFVKKEVNSIVNSKRYNS